MAFDALSMYFSAAQIKRNCLGGRVDKLYMLSADEILLYINTKNGNFKLYASCRANAARVHLTKLTFEAPKQPPMLCMLLRKHLIGGRLTAVEQPDSERILFLDFECMSEIKERVHYRLAVETMGRHSDIILINDKGDIVDALKRVDFTMSSVRQVLPGTKYVMPPQQNKASLASTSAEELANIVAGAYEGDLSRAIIKKIGGICSAVGEEIAYLTQKEQLAGGENATLNQCLIVQFENIKAQTAAGVCHSCMVLDANGAPKDVSCLAMTHYGNSYKVVPYDEIGDALDAFFAQRDTYYRVKSKSEDLFRTLNQKIDRIRRKIAAQKMELQQSEEREIYRICGDLLNTYPHLAQKGMEQVMIPNYYDPQNTSLKVPLSPKLNAAQNAQAHYKKYKKLVKAEQVLKEQIQSGETELVYLESVLDSLNRAEGENDLTLIRQELQQTGYIHIRPGKQMKTKPADPYEYQLEDGYTVLVGRNNLQNDRLTFHIAKKDDIWFHTTSLPGSHTIMLTNGEEFDNIPVRAFTQAAVIAATHSKATDGAQVRVDYTLVKNIKKPPAANPGMVIFHENYSAYVTPDRFLCERLKKK